MQAVLTKRVAEQDRVFGMFAQDLLEMAYEITTAPGNGCFLPAQVPAVQDRKKKRGKRIEINRVDFTE